MLDVSEHAAQRMTQRRVSIQHAERVLTQKPFKYYHENKWKTGYYEHSSRVLIARTKNTVRTVMNRVTPRYIKNLRDARP